MPLNGSQWLLSVTSATSRNSVKKRSTSIYSFNLFSVHCNRFSVSYSHQLLLNTHLSCLQLKPLLQVSSPKSSLNICYNILTFVLNMCLLICILYNHNLEPFLIISTKQRNVITTTTVLISTKLKQECVQCSTREKAIKDNGLAPSQSSLIASKEMMNKHTL